MFSNENDQFNDVFITKEFEFALFDNRGAFLISHQLSMTYSKLYLYLWPVRFWRQRCQKFYVTLTRIVKHHKKQNNKAANENLK